jgi:hypothetical protein
MITSKNMMGVVALGMMVGGLAQAEVNTPPPAPRREPKPGDPPRQLSIDSSSPHYDYATAQRIEVWLNGWRRPDDVRAYDVDEGWILTTHGRKIHGDVEPRWRPAPAPTARAAGPTQERSADYEEQARRRQAEKLARRAARYSK